VSTPRKYMAGSVPRSLRLTRSGLFPPNCIIGSIVMKGASNRKGEATTNIIRDVVMMPLQAFARMKTNIGVNLVLSPALKMGGADFAPGYVFTDIREFVVPADEPDPDTFAKNYFLKKFGLAAADKTRKESSETSNAQEPLAANESRVSAFFRCAREIFVRQTIS